MSRRASVPTRLLFAVFLLSAPLLPAPASAQFASMETDDLRLVYDELNLGYLAPHAARCFTNSLRFHRDLFGYTPSERVTVILNDFGDYGNAGAGAVPRNSLLVSVAPTNMVYETYPANERINTLMNHELVHIVALDQAAGSDRFFRGLFLGKVKEIPEHPETILYGYLTTPRFACPRWYHEGVAVFLETWMAGGLGRAQGAYDEMVFRAMVRDDARFYDPLGLESEGTQIDFQGGVNSYLYGTRFMSWLALTHSPAQVVAWVNRAPGSRRHYASQFHHVFGRSMDDAWRAWIDWEHAFQRTNLDSIRAHPVTAARPLSRRALGSVSRAHVDPERGELYAAVNYPGAVPHVAAISLADGSVRKVKEVKGAALYFVTSLAYDPGSRTLFYTADNNDWRDLMALDPATGEARLLMKDARIGDVSFDRSSGDLWGVRHLNGITTLVRMPPPYDAWKQVHSFPYGRMVYDIDLSPDGSKLCASVGEISGRQTLRIFETAKLLAQDTTSVQVFDFGHAIPESFTFSPDGERLYGSSYYTGVSNIFRYHIEADSIDVVSNAETGFFRPVPLAGDSLIVFEYTGAGFRPGMIPERAMDDLSATRFLGNEVAKAHPEIRDWRLPPPSSVDLEALAPREGGYSRLGALGLASAYPVVEGYKDYPSYGYRVNVSDPVGFLRVEATAGYTPNRDVDSDERIHARMSVERYPWTVNATYNAADFYDLFGPVKTSRKGYSLGIGYERALLYDRPREIQLKASLTGYGGLERLPDYQNVGASFDKLLAGGVRVRGKNLRASIGAVDYERGTKWDVGTGGNLVNGTVHPLTSGTFDFGFPLPLRHSSLWIRTAAGWSPGDRDEPFANFYFGGFGNNWVDYLDPKRYRDATSFPGVDLNAIGGTNYGRVMADWNLPPLRFRRLGIPSFYATWARLSLFGSAIGTNLDARDVRVAAANAGAQVDVRIRLLSHLNLTVSAGYARAYDVDRGREAGIFGFRGETPRRESEETMVSVKIL